jgi:hypothetical protein
LATAQAEADIRQTYFIVDAPTMPANPATSLRQMALAGVVFVIIGGGFGVGVIIGAAGLDRSFRFPVDIEYGLALPVLSSIPDTRPKSSRLAFFRRRASKLAPEKVDRKVGRSLSEDEPIEAAA